MYRLHSTMIFKIVEAFCTPSPISRTTIFMVSRTKQHFVSCTTRGLLGQLPATCTTKRTRAACKIRVKTCHSAQWPRTMGQNGDVGSLIGPCNNHYFSSSVGVQALRGSKKSGGVVEMEPKDSGQLSGN